MTGLVDWAADRARMVLAFIALSIAIGATAYVSLPKEGEPDIEIPALFVSVPFAGISATDSETLLVKPMETELADLDGLKELSSTAAEGYAGVALEFEFGWDKTQVMADVRDAMTKAEAKFPDGADSYSVNEINFSEFPIVIVNLTGPIPERTMIKVAKDLKDRLESLDAVLEAGIAGSRDEMLEVIIDPLRLEAYNVTAGELINVVRNNNQLIAAGEIEGESGAFGVKIPASFDDALDVYALPVKTNGDRVITLGDLAQINLTFEDRTGTARFNGETTVALQVVKRKGFNIIDTVAEVKAVMATAQAGFPPELQASVEVGMSNDQSRQIDSMVKQLEGSVLTAILLVMLVTLAALGIRPSLLVGFAIPTSFLLCFALLAMMGVAISNIVMFGLILAVGMLVDGAIVIVEYADKRIKEGSGPMHAYVEAAKRMFWPVVSSTATTLCAFLPMLLWPGVPGQFMGMLPVTLIFVLSASLVVALIYLPVVGGATGRLSRMLGQASDSMRKSWPFALRLVVLLVGAATLFMGAMVGLRGSAQAGLAGALPGLAVFMVGAIVLSVGGGSIQREAKPDSVSERRDRTAFGKFIEFIVGNPVMPVVTILSVFGFVAVSFMYFGDNNNGTEFFVETEPEQAIVYVQARGNLSLSEKDALLARAENIVKNHPGIDTVFAFAGDGGLNNNTGGAQPPADTIGQIQFETIPWEDRPETSALGSILGFDVAYAAKDVAFDGDTVIDELTAELEQLPGTRIEILPLAMGPASAKPVHLRLKGDNWDDLLAATQLARDQFDATPGLTLIEDTLPLPGIDWQIDVDVEKAGRYGADVATVGAMVQLVTRGILLDTFTPADSEDEIEIRVRLPEEDRVLSTLDTLKVRTVDGLVPLANFISRKPVAKLAEISRSDQKRYFDVKAGVETGWQVMMSGEGDNAVLVGTVAPVADPSLATGIVLRTPAGDFFQVTSQTAAVPEESLQPRLDAGDLRLIAMNPNERIAELTTWLDTRPLPAGIDWEWTGDQEDEAESGAFLMQAMLGALGLMFIILLAQFNSFYNAVLVLLAVVLSVAGVLWGMVLRDQAFSIIMTGTGIVALAGIVVNNNIVLIDTYQEYSRYMPRIEAIIRTAQARIRPVLLTTLTTIAGLMPMMYGLSLDFANGGYTVDSPTALWWKQLATAVVFGLATATVLTLVFTPAALAFRVWFWTYALAGYNALARSLLGGGSTTTRDWLLQRAAREVPSPTILWDTEETPAKPPAEPPAQLGLPLRAAE